MNVAAGPELAAAVTNAGGLGVIGGVGYTPKILRQQVSLVLPLLPPHLAITGRAGSYYKLRTETAALSWLFLDVSSGSEEYHRLIKRLPLPPLYLYFLDPGHQERSR